MSRLPGPREVFPPEGRSLLGTSRIEAGRGRISTFEKEEQGQKYHRIERAYGSFVRSFSQPEDADGNTGSADYTDGMLHGHLPKSWKAEPKAIEIKVA